eukprot:COSAG02_NODE_209_length_28965_cov_18.680143_12_plen_75_part_00
MLALLHKHIGESDVARIRHTAAVPGLHTPGWHPALGPAPHVVQRTKAIALNGEPPQPEPDTILMMQQQGDTAIL